MKQPIFSLIVNRFKMLSQVIRLNYFKLLGLDIKSKVILGKITCEWPKSVRIGNECNIQDGVDFRITFPFSETNYIQIGDRVFIGRCCEFNCTDKIIIGNDCMIASNTTFVDVAHSIEVQTTMNSQPAIHSEIIVGDDVWIGTGSIVLKGVMIGSGSVIGAGSLVNKNIPAYEIWAGSPARFIRKRT